MWKKSILSLIKKRTNRKVGLAIDTSTNATRKILINNIIKLFGEVKPDTTLIQADYKIRSITSIQEPEIKWFTHGKASYTDVLEWGQKENIDTLFYITDVTGYIYDELEIDYEVIWLIPDDFLPRVPFGKAIRIA